MSFGSILFRLAAYSASALSKAAPISATSSAGWVVAVLATSPGCVVGASPGLLGVVPGSASATSCFGSAPLSATSAGLGLAAPVFAFANPASAFGGAIGSGLA